ncbi:PAS domain S-box protein [uncultured Cocleimonas sp.]|uniref:PAS domain-containing hybrid sensor histidine kinase/response regulator n=1 Tax=uncultured Cocleimonas sp. TaxID=1051587 RepID=UPI002625CAF6|nr:PAS domain S-box protein [uncultured Cocleimonas sp.]
MSNNPQDPPLLNPTTNESYTEDRVFDLSTVLEDSLNEIFIFDASDLGFIQINRGARNNLGYSSDELLQMTPIDIKPEHDYDSFMKVLEPLTSGREQKIQFNTIHQRKDGSKYLVEVHLQKMQFEDRSVYVAIILDITEQTQNNVDLIRANAFLDSAPDATVVVDDSGKIQVANKQMVKLLGYSQDEMKNMNVDMLVPSRYRDNHANHRKNFSDDPKTRGMGIGLDLSAMTKDGKEIPIEISLSPIETVEGTLVAAAIRDISERKASEHELQLAKQVAENATAAKTRFLAAASHDLRQPLQALRLYLSALSSKLDQPKAIQLSEKMNLSLDTMGELLDALLDISTLESGSVTADKRDVKLSEILNKLIADNAPLAEEKGLLFLCEGQDCIIHTDPVLLQRIIENFITNAIRYTEAGKITVSGALADGVIRISVKDTGVGIPDEALERIFDEFVQLDNAVRNRSKGLGLGLSIVKHIARLLELPIGARSVVGFGSTFSVDIPLSDSKEVIDNKKETIHFSSSKEKEPTILIVDDDPAIVDAMMELLTAFDVKVITANNGPEALAKIADGIKPDFLVSDYRMPDMNGVELITEIRAKYNEHLPVVIMTGDTSAEKINDANLSNCSVLHKPINISQLLSLIESIKT